MKDVVIYTREVDDFDEYLRAIIYNHFKDSEEDREAVMTAQTEEIVDILIFHSIRLKELMLSARDVSLEDINTVNLIKFWLKRTPRKDVIDALRRADVFNNTKTEYVDEFLLRLVSNNIYSYFKTKGGM